MRSLRGVNNSAQANRIGIISGKNCLKVCCLCRFRKVCGVAKELQMRNPSSLMQSKGTQTLMRRKQLRFGATGHLYASGKRVPNATIWPLPAAFVRPILAFALIAFRNTHTALDCLDCSIHLLALLQMCSFWRAMLALGQIYVGGVVESSRVVLGVIVFVM